MQNFLYTFIPIFVAIDAMGLIPTFLVLTETLTVQERRRVLVQSLITASTIAIAFIFLGNIIFDILGISIHDFMIAGGIILLIFATRELLLTKHKDVVSADADVGIVPLGTPLITGPAVLATCLILLRTYGVLLTLSSLFANMLVTGVVLYCSSYIINIFGKEGIKAGSKVIMVFLAAIAVMFIRKGIEGILGG